MANSAEEVVDLDEIEEIEQMQTDKNPTPELDGN